jgi:hypothetical protein
MLTSSRFIACNALIALCACALSFTSGPAAAAPRGEAEALRVADAKLAALAREAKGEAPPPAAAPKKAKKKQPPPVRKKRTKKVRHSDAAVTAANVPAPKPLSRRLSLGEVQHILATTRDFTGADLSGLDLTGHDLSGSYLNRARLRATNLERVDLTESDLELADLTGANLRGASLNQARLRGTRLEGAQLDGALWIDKTVCRSGSVGRCIE